VFALKIQRRHRQLRNQRHVVKDQYQHQRNAGRLEPLPREPAKIDRADFTGAVAADTLCDRNKQDTHDQGRQGENLQRRLPIEKSQQESTAERGNHLGADTAADRMDTEHLCAPRRHLLDQHPGCNGVPESIAHNGEGEQQGDTPEPGRERGAQVADRDPPEAQQHQQAGPGRTIRDDARGYIGQACADTVNGEDQADLDRPETHADCNGWRQQPQGPGHPIVGQMPEEQSDQQKTMLLIVAGGGQVTSR